MQLFIECGIDSRSGIRPSHNSRIWETDVKGWDVLGYPDLHDETIAKIIKTKIRKNVKENKQKQMQAATLISVPSMRVAVKIGMWYPCQKFISDMGMKNLTI